MRAVFIDAKNRTVEDIEHDGKLHSMQESVGARLVTAVHDVSPCGDVLFVDDEGLLHLTGDNPFFYIDGHDAPLAGNGIIFGPNPVCFGMNASVEGADYYKHRIKFCGQRAVVLRESLKGSGFGVMSVLELVTKEKEGSNG